MINHFMGLYDNSLPVTLFRNLYGRVTRLQTHASLRELVWTLIPTLILFLIAIPSIELLYLMDLTFEREGPILTYKIIGHQWYWSYDYLGIADPTTPFKWEWDGENWVVEPLTVQFDSYMLPEADVKEIGGLRLLEVDTPLILPFDQNLHLLVTSADVLHAWAIPSAGVKVDAIPGRLNHICVIFKRIGTFYGQCSEIRGVNHGFMPIKVEVIDLLGGFDESASGE